MSDKNSIPKSSTRLNNLPVALVVMAVCCNLSAAHSQNQADATIGDFKVEPYAPPSIMHVTPAQGTSVSTFPVLSAPGTKPALLPVVVPDQAKAPVPEETENTGSVFSATPLPNFPIMRSGTESTPDTDGNQSSTITLPPDLRNRPPVPAPPAVTLLSPLGDGRPKPTLAWRAKAYKMRDDDSHSPTIKSSKIFSASPSETFAALASACGAFGLEVDDQFESSGQLSARLTERSSEKTRLIFSIQPTGANTIVKAGIDQETASYKKSLFDDIFQKTGSILSQKGLL